MSFSTTYRDCSLRERWVLFDAVATLMEPRPSVVEVYLEAGARWGWSGGAEVLGNRFRLAMKQCFVVTEPSSEATERNRWKKTVRAVFRELSDADASAVFQELWSHFAATTSWSVFSDVDPCWKTLANHGYRIAIASNFDSRLLEIANALTPLDRADRIFISTELGWSKPDGRFYESILRELNSARVWMVGDDRQNDIIAAQDAGIDAIWLRRDSASDLPPGDLSTLADLAGQIGMSPRTDGDDGETGHDRDSDSTD